MTYSFVKGQKVYSALAADITAPTTTVTPVATYQNLLNTTAKVVYEKGVNADTTYRVYAKGADGKVLSVVAHHLRWCYELHCSCDELCHRYH